MDQSSLTLLQNSDITDFRRDEVTESRWSYCWSLFKDNFLKFFYINLLTIVFCIPALAVLFFSSVQIDAMSMLYPFSPNIGMGYPLVPDVTGMYESIVLSNHLAYYSLLIIAAMIAAVGISGAVYSVRKMICTQGEYSLKSYFHGVKKCYLSTLVPVVLFFIAFFAINAYWDWANLQMALGTPSGWYIAGFVFAIIVTVFIGMVCMWMLAVGSAFKLHGGSWLKESLSMMFTLLPHTIIFLGLAFAPLWLFLIGGFFQTLSYLFMLVFGFSYILLMWMGFTQGVFDTIVTPTEKPKQVKTKTVEEQQEEHEDLSKLMLASGKSQLFSTPIRPIDRTISILPVRFTRTDMQKTAEQRSMIAQEVETYSQEHSTDGQYVEYNKLFEEREKPVKPPKRKGRNKRLGRDNLLDSD